MPRPQRDYRAEYAARKARGDKWVSSTARRQEVRRHGYSSEKEQRQRRAAGQLAPSDPKAKTTRVNMGPAVGQIMGSGSAAAVRAEVQDAAARGDRVALQVTFEVQPGVFRTRYIDRGDPNILAGGGAGHGTSGYGAPSAPVQVISGPAVAAGGGGGIDAQALADFFDLYDDEDLWDAIAELYDSDYF